MRAHSIYVLSSSDDYETQVILDGVDISAEIRSEQCGQDASQIAAIQEVRHALLERQRNFAQPPGLVTDGRDMGTVVFPNAILKIFYMQVKKKEQIDVIYS